MNVSAWLLSLKYCS